MNVREFVQLFNSDLVVTSSVNLDSGEQLFTATAPGLSIINELEHDKGVAFREATADGATAETAIGFLAQQLEGQRVSTSDYSKQAIKAPQDFAYYAVVSPVPEVLGKPAVSIKKSPKK